MPLWVILESKSDEFFSDKTPFDGMINWREIFSEFILFARAIIFSENFEATAEFKPEVS